MLDHTAVGAVAGPVRRTWTADDSLLYALAVGAGPHDLALTTENSAGITQAAVPTYAALLAGGTRGLRDALGTWPASATVHGGQRVRWHAPLPPRGEVDVTSRVARIEDKGSGALVEIEADAVTPGGVPLFTAVTSLFLRGQGGWGERVSEPAPGWPDREPDLTTSYPTAPTQALLYRLCGDRNPLHSDPTFARAAGFPRPILHGLCTWGIAGRLLARATGGRLTEFGGRFRAPVYPGDTITVRAWADGDAYLLTAGTDGTVVLDRGHAVIGEAA